MRCAFRGVRVGPFADLDLAVGAGEALVLTGRRGLGKHRLLQVALGVSRPDAGEVWLFGVPLAGTDARAREALRARCGYAPARGALISNLSVADNVALPLRYHARAEEAEVGERVQAALAALGVAGLANERPAALAASDMRLVSLARVAATAPEFAVLEDPYEGLEDSAADGVHAALRGLLASGCGLLVTTSAARLDTSFGGRLRNLPALTVRDLEAA